MPDYKPIVVVSQSAARASLQQARVIPQDAFHELGTEPVRNSERDKPAVYLWPYDIPYSNSSALLEKVKSREKTADIPAFYGMPETADTSIKKHEERLLQHLLFGSVVVHIIFLEQNSGENKRHAYDDSYAKFKSFSEIAQWSQDLKSAMDIRFINEQNLSHHILVIIASGQQVKTSRAEIDKFKQCIDPKNGMFRSCYFMDYNLHVGDTSNIIFSSDVWNIMVSRLLLAFILSQDQAQGQNQPFWDKPGLKLWRAHDCLLEIDKNSYSEAMTSVLSQAHNALQGKQDNSANQCQSTDVFTGGLPDKCISGNTELKPSGESFWRETPNGGWSDFMTKECVRQTKNAERWSTDLDRIRVEYNEWQKGNKAQDYTGAISNVFCAVDSNPGILFKKTQGIFDAIGKAQDSHKNDKQTSIDCWNRLVQTEQERNQKLKLLENNAGEFQKAQNHYIGWVPGITAFITVSAFLGWCVWRFFKLFGHDGMSIPSAVFVVAGGLCALFLVIFLQWHAGKRGEKEIAAESEEADRLMTKRDGDARALLSRGLRSRDELNLQTARFRVWTLMKRTQDILETELQPQNVSVHREKKEDGADVQTLQNADSDRVVEDFLMMTRVIVGPFPMNIQSDETKKYIEALVEKYWSDDKEGSFLALWKKICAEDQEHSGYFPARLFISEIHDFVCRFTDEIRHNQNSRILEQEKQKVDEKLDGWFRKIDSGDRYLMTTGAITSMHIKEHQDHSHFVFISNDSQLNAVSEEMEKSARESNDDTEFVFRRSALLQQTPLLALLYREYTVQFTVVGASDSNDEGNLTFAEVSDAI